MHCYWILMCGSAPITRGIIPLFLQKDEQDKGQLSPRWQVTLQTNAVSTVYSGIKACTVCMPHNPKVPHCGPLAELYKQCYSYTCLTRGPTHGGLYMVNWICIQDTPYNEGITNKSSSSRHFLITSTNNTVDPMHYNSYIDIVTLFGWQLWPI